MHPSLIPADELDDFIIIRVRAFARKVQRAILSEALNNEDMPVLEWQLLFSIARFGSCHLAHVTAQTSIDPAHGSRAVAALERKGLVERREDPGNRRRKLISLTSTGQSAFERIWPRARQVMRTATNQLDESEFQDLKRLLSLANENADVLSKDTRARAQETRSKEDEKLPV
ncbi:MarR family winged helix-turn-helix transcriptional regulator [Roseobacteraceae bacterium S113]